MRRRRSGGSWTGWAVLLVLGGVLCPAAARAGDADAIAESLGKVETDSFTAEQQDELERMLAEHARSRRDAANRRSTAAWRKIDGRERWEAFRNERLEALRASLGSYPEPPEDLDTRVAGKLSGEGYKVEKLAFESRLGLWVTAHLYVPDPPRKSMPGLVISHSHHRPKEQGELQDMGAMWARQGCLVLVPDHVGHGERRQHPFARQEDHPAEFRVSRQDYYFRYNTGMQLHLAGDSLMGWMAWDLMRGVDLLLAREGIDPQRIILLGGVAGGGDPCGVTAALDERIAAAVPFNFGGPQPETRYPLPDDAEETFNYAGGGSWESTRNLRLSCRDGFLHWVIVGGIGPRRLIHAHEFSWDREHDPVWKRYLRIWGEFYDARDHLDYTHGYGLLKQSSDEASHCGNIGRPHRERIHQAFRRWFGIGKEGEVEYSHRFDSDQLLCLTDEARRELEPKKLHELAGQIGRSRAETAREELKDLEGEARRERLRAMWARVLGDVEPAGRAKVVQAKQATEDGVQVSRVVLETEPGIQVPLVILQSGEASDSDRPVVVGVAQAGKERFLQERQSEIAKLLAGGAAVCLPDLRGTGETRPGSDRGRRSWSTSISSTELMLGQTLVGSRLKDLRSVIGYLRGREGLDAERLVLWGESFAPANPPDRDVELPLGIGGQAEISEPLGGLLALLGALYEEDVQAAYARGGLASFGSVLDSQFVHVPHDAVVPEAMSAGDLPLLAAALAPRPVRLAGLVDGLNRRLSAEAAGDEYELARSAYKKSGAPGRFALADAEPGPAAYLLGQLNGGK